MSLDSVIAPEILNDEFHQTIFTLASTQPLTHILEIGSSSGEGSTDAWVRGIAANPHRPTLHCIELSKPRFQALANHYSDNPHVRCYWASSVSLDCFPSEADVTNFYHTVPSKLRQWPLEQVLGWLRDDIAYLKTHNAPDDGIKQALRASKQTAFDAVLIDGSEFTGVAEFAQVYGARWILLDDILTYKNWEVVHFLSKDSRYQVVAAQTNVRNGFAVFLRKQ
ncbi:MAG: hypothetical protein ACK5GN_14380 [Pseudomonadota bacterium]|jgi:hypothetical protein